MPDICLGTTRIMVIKLNVLLVPKIITEPRQILLAIIALKVSIQSLVLLNVRRRMRIIAMFILSAMKGLS
jgi:hypothetical protein